MGKLYALGLGAAVVIGAAVYLVAGGGEKKTEILNVSYDPTRELYKDINEKFAEHYAKEKGVKLEIKQSHGGSGSQARSVVDGLQADVVTLALPSDTDAIARKGLIAEDWRKRLPHDSLPYTSTIVFVVRKGNPKGIKDWPDLIKDDVQVITPNPKTSGNGKLSFLAAWGSVLASGKTDADAREFVARLYKNAPVLDNGARGSTVTFSQKKIGDVHLTWENEAHHQIKEFKNEGLEIVYPTSSIRAEPAVAWVDKVVEKKGTREIAEAYLRFLYTDDAQEIIAKNYYRPFNEEVLKKHASTFPKIELFSISRVAKNWDDANEKYFKDGAVFDQLYQKQRN